MEENREKLGPKEWEERDSCLRRVTKELENEPEKAAGRERIGKWWRERGFLAGGRWR
jgi:hypothetical protein